MKRITGRTKLAGVIGHPLTHTLSPAMHNAVYEALELDWVYLPLHVEDEVGLRRLVAAIRSMDFVGFNITMPFKQAMLELCDEVAMAANMAGAVNTVHCDCGRLVGYNTDGRGLLESLSSEAGFQPEGAEVVVLGAGGAAAAAIVAFVLGKAARITVVNRNLDHAEELVERMRPNLCGVPTGIASLQQAEEPVRSADVIVNCTPVGMQPGDRSPIDTRWLGPGQVVYDMVYGTAAPTELVRGAREVGAVALDGLGMLVSQGATAVDIWSDSKQIRTPRDVMRTAAEHELARRIAEG